MKRLLIIGVMCLPLWCYAQTNITAAEYFFDTDPGTGSATALPAFAPATSINVSFLAASSGLTKGMHMLGVRVRDSNNDWSIPQYTPLYVLTDDPFTLTNITQAEYFIDSDPGIGNGTALPPFVAATPVDVNFLANTSSLPKGMHTIGIRFRNASNEWSIPSYLSFYVLANNPSLLVNLNAAEYFFDTDPGVGNATAVPGVTAGATIDVTFAANSAALAVGLHVLGVRTRDVNGEWSITSFTNVYVDRDRTITKLEYFFDTDPGSGNGTSIAVTPSTNILDQIYNMNSSSLANGTHTVNIRVAGQNNFWSMTEMASFIICTTATPSISANTVCTGSATTLSDNSTNVLGGDVFSWDYQNDAVPDASTSGNKTFVYGAAGTYTATLSINRAGCVATTSTTVTVDDAALVTTGPAQNICVGSTASLTATIGGLATNGTWSTSGSGTFNSSTSFSPVYSPGFGDILSGTVTTTFTTNDPPGACPAATASTIITISPPAVVSAGSDQSFCGSAVVTMAGTRGGAATSSTWTTSGDGNFSNANALNSTYTPGAGDLTAGTATLTLTTDDPAGPCPAQSDQVVLTFTKPISIVIQQIPATLSGPVTVSVTSGGTFNSGDVLTTSILVAPKKGTAQLQAGNNLVYTANQGTVGKDSVRVQVCNQCSQCDAEYIYFDIQNAAPTIQPPAASVSSGGTVTIPLASSVSDINNNIDLSTLTIVTQPLSGAIASIDASYNLIVNYTGISFSGTDQLQVRVCDLSGVCAVENIMIQVGSLELVVYNVVSPNGDGKHDFFEVANIDLYPQNQVKIFNRWGDMVYETSNYNNDTNKFTGKSKNGNGDLPAGTYYYLIDFLGSAPSLQGFLVINR